MSRVARTGIVALVVALALVAWVPGRTRAIQAAPFFFIQLSDPQLGFFNNDIEFSQETANFEFAVATINRLKPAFVVITGDLVNKPGDAAQIAEYKRIKGKVLPSIPVYQMPGNHDIENAPTPATVAAFNAVQGADHYVFRYQNLAGIVLNSTLIHTPDKVPQEAAAQDAWLRVELANAKASGATHRIVFQHHPWFLSKADEDDQLFNIPKVRRAPLLALFHEAGVKTLVSGHYHQNAVATDGDIEAITTGPVGKPLGTAKSGLRLFTVTDTAITHRYVELGEMPTSVDPAGRRGGGPAAPAAGRGRAQ